MNNKWTIERLKEEVQKYSSRSEFHDKCRNGYDFALENNFLDEYFPTEKKHRPAGYWNNYENCKLETSKYTILDDFRIKSSGCYDALLRNGWLEELTNHMIRKKKPNTHWTKELCANIVSKFNDIKELTKEYPGCVNAIYSNGWGELLDKIRQVKKPWTYETAKEEVKKYELIVDIINNDSGLYGAIRKNKWDDLLEDKRGNYKPASVYDKNKCHECALQCSSISEFSKKFSGAYQNCLKYGWLDEVCSHIKRIKRKNGYWNNENVIEEAKKYNTLREFREKSQGAYDYASRNNLMNSIKTFLEAGCKPIGYWTYERCLEEAKKYKTLIDFHDKSSSAYTYSRKNNWLEKFIWLESTRNKSYGKDYTIEELNELSKQCVNRHEFKRKYHHAWNYARKNKLMKELEFKPILGVEIYKKHLKDGSKTIVSKPRNTNKGRVIPRKWTYENCVEESKKYEYYHDFMIKSSSAYATACYRKWIKDFIWLKKERVEPGHWTYKNCLEEAKKYKTLTDFHDNSNTAYSVSLEKGWIKDFTWFEKISSRLEGIAKHFFTEKNILFEEQKKFDWLKYKKPLSLDFYLPEYNVAIECQGIQHFEPQDWFGCRKSNGFTEVLKRDKIKRELCEKYGIKMFYFSNLGIKYPYQVYENLNKMLEDIKDYSYFDTVKKLITETTYV